MATTGEIRYTPGIDLHHLHHLKGDDTYILLGQDADDEMSGFESAEAFSGKLSLVNMWSFALTPAEVHKSYGDCGQDNSSSVGNVVNWRDQDWEYSNVTTNKENICNQNNTTSQVVTAAKPMSFYDGLHYCDSLGGRLPYKLAQSSTIDRPSWLVDAWKIGGQQIHGESEEVCRSPFKPFWTGLLYNGGNSTHYSFYSDHCKCNSTAQRYKPGNGKPKCVSTTSRWKIFEEENCESNFVCAICLVPRSVTFYLKGLCQDLTSDTNGYFDTRFYLAGVVDDYPIFM